ncbi:PadR family transcriptional regulator [Ktedonosporobacter rubrisoli]|uniref:PadR family transcriptional regulator n=1 Tax=Ktedonosporobacter rubrisoli TaxID=2509675 RepID=A0A4P6JWI0_KTERU|nr:PadR family transcriptional regulator [Ktedonosporobacter rubrisoli]QBD79742.1 PadR family transcriptional regulator [Ktedonosporobacter rubrisoli]
MTTKRKIQNPLALAVLACLTEHPMHPYEIATTLRERGKDQSIKLNFGALYTVVEALKLHGLIRVGESVREGRRPERTVYRLTRAGRIELIDWLSELISRPVKEYTQFEAGLSLIPILPPEDAAVLLEQRCTRLEMEIEQQRSFLQSAMQRGISRLNLIESEYPLALCEAELAWTRHFAEAIRSGTLEGLTEWEAFSRATASQEYEEA